jgi:nicotinate-nucleotide adenylyltransferase
MKIGLYFGSFNPVHVGHLIIANFVAYNTGLEQVWLVLSPRNPLKLSGTLLNEYDRLHLLELAIEKEPRLRVSNIEFFLPKPSYTIDTLTYLEEKYPEHEFSVIMGSDSLENLHRWKNYEQLLARFPLFIYCRPGHPVKTYPAGKIIICEAPLLDISSSLIRKMIKEKKSVRFMVPENVYEYMTDNRYYQN